MAEEKKVEKKVEVKKKAEVVVNKKITAEDYFAKRNQTPIECYKVEGMPDTYIHGLTGATKSQWIAENVKEKEATGVFDNAKVEARLMILCVRDEDGKRLFTLKDILKLIELPCVMTAPIIKICFKLSGMGDGADEAILRNFEEAATDDS